ncbi:MAG: DUF1080 domain-containing protein [Bacteroidales bacterium]|nr:DUF1080 domain-containing protein [Bacteroidales bacterium]
MKIFRILFAFALATIATEMVDGQDVRRLETRVADILAQMPAADSQTAAASAGQIFELGPGGWDMIFSQLVPAGTGNDIQVRFAVEGVSRYLSSTGNEAQLGEWEKKCLEWLEKTMDSESATFIISQLGYVSSDFSAPRMAGLLEDEELAPFAVSVLVSTGTELSATTLLESLGNTNNKALSESLNGLASLGSTRVTPAMKLLAGSTDLRIREAAYRALAATGSDEAADILLKAASGVSFQWDSLNTVSRLLDLADNMGAAGNMKGMDKIVKQVSKSETVQYQSAVLNIKAKYYGDKVLRDLLRAMKSDNAAYRGAAMRIASGLNGSQATAFWVDAIEGLRGERKAEILLMLGDRGDMAAAELLGSLLTDDDLAVRVASASSLARVSGKQAIPLLIEYLISSSDGADQDAASAALVTLLDSNSTDLLAGRLASADPVAGSTIIGLLSWSRSEKYFADVYKYTGSDDDGLRVAAFTALKNLAAEENQKELLTLFDGTRDRQEIIELQNAVVASAAYSPDKEKRVQGLLQLMEDDEYVIHIIPVLARLGGSAAAGAVLKQFESGDAAMRDACFEALIYWSDHHALNSLYEVCASGNKRFGNASFEAYLSQVGRSNLLPEQKLLYLKKIMPMALTDEQKELVLEAAGNIKTFQSLFFSGEYFEVKGLEPVAARSVMKIAMPAAGETVGMSGSIVRELLNKSIKWLMGNESEYDKERMRKYLLTMPDDEGFVPMFNGIDLTGWQGLVGNPVSRSRMTPAQLAAAQKEADKKMLENWSVRDGMIWFSGTGDNLCSVKKYGDFEMLVDWKITKNGDSGIYLRGSPQVQIWDTSRTDVGAQVGSGGLYNNQIHQSKPLVVADNKVGEWNSLRILMEGEVVSVWLNGILVVEKVIMENYWDRSIPIFPSESIELQAHGTDLAFRDIYIREIGSDDYNLTDDEVAEGFTSIFNGKNLDGWIGDKVSYVVENGMIVIKPDKGSGGNLLTAKEYSDFVLRFEFQLTPGANNGLGIRTPPEGDAAYVGMELQILDDKAPVYANLQPYQYHGSVYGVIPARRGYQNPVGDWNYQEVTVKGTHVKVVLNGTVIVDGDIAEARDKGTMDGQQHPGLKRNGGHIGFLGHGSVVKFRNIRIREY